MDDLITDLERKVADPMVDAAEREMQLGRGDEVSFGPGGDTGVGVVESVPGKASEAQFSGALGEGMEAAGEGAAMLPKTYAQKFSPANRDDLRSIFTDRGADALEEFVRRLELPPEGLAQVEIPTSAGFRKVDRLFRDSANIVLREVKHYASATLTRTERITQELNKDIAILGSFGDALVDWHITGNISQDFLHELEILSMELNGRFRIVRGNPFNIIL